MRTRVTEDQRKQLDKVETEDLLQYMIDRFMDAKELESKEDTGLSNLYHDVEMQKISHFFQSLNS